MKTVVTFRTYTKGDELEILRLWNAVYPHSQYDQDRWLKWWHWMYEENPAGSAVISLAEHGGKIIGQYCLTPIDMRIGDDVLRGLQGVDSMTHPNYRRQGINSALMRHALQQSAQRGFQIAIAFPAQGSPSHASHLKLGWFDVGTMQSFIKPLNWTPIVKLQVKNGYLSALIATVATFLFDRILFRTLCLHRIRDLRVEQVANFQSLVKKPQMDVSARRVIMVERTPLYLNWRYSAPGQTYSIFHARTSAGIRGYVVLQRRTMRGVRLGHILDLRSDSEEVMHALVSTVVEDCRLNNVDLVLHQIVRDKAARRILRRSGFMGVPWVGRLMLVAYAISSPLPNSVLRDPGNWFVQIGDSDVRDIG